MTSQSMANTATLGRPAAEIARGIAWTLLALMVAAAVVLAWRRLGGQLHRPLEPAALFVAGAMIASGAAAVRRLWRVTGAGRLDVLLMTVVTAAVVALGMALCVRGTPTSGLAALWGIVGVGEGLAWRPLAWRRAVKKTFRPARVDAAHAPATHHVPLARHPVAEDAPPEEHVTQQFVRGLSADGTETLSGWVRVALVAGQRTASAHVAFCPPFAHAPSLVVKQRGGPPGRIKTVQLLPYGARFDVKLARPAVEPTAVLLEFAATLLPSPAE